MILGWAQLIVLMCKQFPKLCMVVIVVPILVIFWVVLASEDVMQQSYLIPVGYPMCRMGWGKGVSASGKQFASTVYLSSVLILGPNGSCKENSTLLSGVSIYESALQGSSNLRNPPRKPEH